MSKFEYLIGTENDFNGAVCDCTLKIWHDFLGPMFCTESTIPRISGVSIIAMRRIIREPKRWTVEDQKAGRLPEVGCMVMVTSVDECASVAAINNDAVCVVFHDGEFTTLHKSGISPLETPEEKVERLRREWVELVRDKAMISADEYTTEAIYDALLSGALSVPTKGGE